MTINFQRLGPSTLFEWAMTRFWTRRRIIYAMRKRRAKLMKLGGGLPFPGTVARLKALKVATGQLSPEPAIMRATERMAAHVVQLRQSYPQAQA